MDHQVRRIRADEWQAYRRLRLEALADAPLAFVERHEEAVAHPEALWRNRVARGAVGRMSSTFVAVADDRFVAKASCFVEEEITGYVSAHIVTVYVTPSARGSGVADALLADVVRWARDEARAERIRLFVMEVNERAAAFYRRLGFVPTGATMAYPPDPTYREHEYELRSGPP